MRRAVVLLLLLTSLAVPLFSQSSEMEQIVSSIQPEMWYLGSDVRVALIDLMTLAQAQIKSTSEEAVKVAVAPILERNVKLEKQNRALGWTLGIVGALVVGGVGGYLIFR